MVQAMIADNEIGIDAERDLTWQCAKTAAAALAPV